MASTRTLRVGVIGPAGFGGSYLCVELLNRGHTVIGISRDPEKLGKHERYIARSIDIDQVSVTDLAKSFQGVDVLVSEYGPHTAGAGALLYSTSLRSERYPGYVGTTKPMCSAFSRNCPQAYSGFQDLFGGVLPLRRRSRQSTRPRNVR